VEFFNDATVQEHFKVLGVGNEWVSPQPITDVSCEVRTPSPILLDTDAPLPL
jgi:hypothetical protein